MSDDGRPEGTPEVAALLRDIERSAEVDAEATKRILENHLLHSDQVIGNIAALRTVHDDSLLELVAKGNPT